MATPTASDPRPEPVLNNVPLFYTGRAPNPRRTDPLPKPVRIALDIPSLYAPDEDLIAAANVALTLRLPLLLTGKPGTGKTELARNLAEALHKKTEGRLFEVGVTSNTDRADLLYRYDELSRLRDAYGMRSGDKTRTQQADPEGTPRAADRDYLELRGLGAAIVAAGNPSDRLASLVPGRPLPSGLATLADLLGPPPWTEPATVPLQTIAVPAPDQPDPRTAFFLPKDSPPPVVLIDEIDKAPRELPNDLLTELDRMRFSIPELGVRIELRDTSRWPVVVITSNAERPLSDAFLRRCVCFEVEVPGIDKLREILASKLRALDLLDGGLPDDVVRFVQRLRDSRDIDENEKPGTARVLDFAMLIADRARFGGKGMRELPEAQRRAALTALLPSRAAQAAALRLWSE